MAQRQLSRSGPWIGYGGLACLLWLAIASVLFAPWWGVVVTVGVGWWGWGD